MQWTKQFSGSAFLKPVLAALALMALISGYTDTAWHGIANFSGEAFYGKS